MTSEPPAEHAEPTVTPPAVDRVSLLLRELFGRTWIPMSSLVGVYIREWAGGDKDGYASRQAEIDSISIVDWHTATAERVNPHGVPLWRCKGTLAAVAAALQALPAPGTPGAPTMPIL